MQNTPCRYLSLEYTVPDLPRDFAHTLTHNLCLWKELPIGPTLALALW